MLRSAEVAIFELLIFFFTSVYTHSKRWVYTSTNYHITGRDSSYVFRLFLNCYIEPSQCAIDTDIACHGFRLATGSGRARVELPWSAHRVYVYST
jgi:hypothetical protein